MDFAASLVAADATMTALVVDGVANGNVEANHLQPLAGTIDVHMYVPLTAANQLSGLEDMICRMTGADLEVIPGNRASFTVGVLVALARGAASRLIGAYLRGLNRAECVTTAGVLTVHANHQVAIAALLTKYSPTAARLLGVLVYNCMSVANCGHSHVPAGSGKLFRSTKALSPMAGIANIADVNQIFHDTFHNIGGTLGSDAIRHVDFKTAMTKLGYGNLAKRIPVKASDTAVACNYSSLYITAASLVEAGVGVPDNLATPAVLQAQIDAIGDAANDQVRMAAIATLQVTSKRLLEPALYLAGYILGCTRRLNDVPDMTLRDANRSYNTTILGSPFIGRECASGAGMGAWSAGVAQGYTTPTAEQRNAEVPALLALLGVSVAAIV